MPRSVIDSLFYEIFKNVCFVRRSEDTSANIVKATALVRAAAASGARVILLQELFAGRYFCQDQLVSSFALAAPLEGHPLIDHFARLAAELDVVRDKSTVLICNILILRNAYCCDFSGCPNSP